MDFITFEQYNEELWTLVVKASSTEIFKFEEDHNLDLTVYPLMKRCFVVCDNHALQLLRKFFNVEQEFPGEYPAKKSHYEFNLSMKNDYLAFARNKRIQTFFKGFSHPGIYNIKFLGGYNTEDYRMNYKLSLDAYDEKEVVLNYLKGALSKGFDKEGLMLEKITC